MATCGDLEAFFLEFDKLLEKVESCLFEEYLERPLQSCLKILMTIISKVEAFEAARTENEMSSLLLR